MRLALARALVMSAGSEPRRSGGALRRLAGGDSPEALAAALRTEGWDAAAIEAAADGSGKSAVHFAAWRGHPDNVGVLLDFGCGVDAAATGEFSYGKTPLFFAVTRCRDETVLRLLEAGAATKIVNNKGQSVRTLALSHVSDATYAAVVAAEERDGRPWRNYRASHGDGLVYGDLDARFLERELTPEDTVVDVAVNPTTKASRHGAFARKNPDAVVEAPPKQRPRPKAPFVASSERPADAEALAAACRACRGADDLAAALERVAGAWSDFQGAWIADVAATLEGCADLREAVEVLEAPERASRLAARLGRRALDDGPPPPPPPPPRMRRPKADDVAPAPPVDATLPRAALAAPATWVDDVAGVDAARAALRAANRAGFDAEFSAAGGLATLQVALDGGRTFVVDARRGDGAYADAYARLLEDLNNLPFLYGYATREDLRLIGGGHNWRNVVDLQPPRAQQPSLQRTAAATLGVYVDKAEQCSDWDRRPLSASQLAYAALDARLCLDLADAVADARGLS